MYVVVVVYNHDLIKVIDFVVKNRIADRIDIDVTSSPPPILAYFIILRLRTVNGLNVDSRTAYNKNNGVLALPRIKKIKNNSLCHAEVQS